MSSNEIVARKLIQSVFFENWPNSDIFSIQRITDEMHTRFDLVRKNSETYEFIYLLSGKVIVNHQGVEYMAGKGDTILLPRHIPHRIYPADSFGVRCIRVTVCGEYCDILYNIFSLETEVVYKGMDISSTLKRMFEFCLEEKSYNEKISFCCGGISELFHKLSSTNKKTTVTKNKSIHYIKAVIERHLETFYSNQQLADLIKMSISPMVKKFKNEFGVTPIQYQLEIKLLEAKKSLLNTEMSIKEISASLGFCDATYFSSSFKKRFGVSPKVIRSKKLQVQE